MYRVSYPLPLTNPELIIIEKPGYTEYRVENWRLARDGSGHVVYGFSGYTWKDMLLIAVLSFFLQRVHNTSFRALAMAACFVALFWTKTTQILSESLIVIEPHGIQLETCRGLPSIPLQTTRRFIPASALECVIINEALQRWNVRYYLAALSKGKDGKPTVHVAFENILPYFPVVLEIYRGVHDAVHDWDHLRAS
ncbi:hypothetical protein BD626DRAFT_500808 [Schizophyllum amplum]|uniref:Phosphatidylinositol N-acetylglucosaminyltransferase subunit H conserved domain-containing protein n=1 Tax=Schizophyllum amplum TaxID=97359 RepID=A0A550CAQ1_9AGAR|nr:hypothetical protein BD626DRAFT_500808 [Auriculariopsis ampla]